MNTALVVIYPETLHFGSNALKEKISIVNPLDSPITFALKCTNPSAFEIKQVQGEILPSRTLDISIKLIDRRISTEQLQIRVWTLNRVRKLAEKVITIMNSTGHHAEGSSTAAEFEDHREHFHSISSKQLRQRSSKDIVIRPNVTSIDSTATNTTQFPYFAYFIYFILVLCVIILLLPHEPDSDTFFQFLCTTVTIKITAAFVAGMITTFLMLTSRHD